MRFIRIVILLINFANISLFAQTKNELNDIGTIVNFKFISITLTKNWSYEIQPNVPYDSIRMVNKEGNIALLIAYQKFDFEHFDFVEWEHTERFKMLNRALTFPVYEGCQFKAVGLDNDLWGRKGILSKFDLYNGKEYIQENIVGSVYNFGEADKNIGMILTITCYVSGKEEDDLISIIKSIKQIDETNIQ